MTQGLRIGLMLLAVGAARDGRGHAGGLAATGRRKRRPVPADTPKPAARRPDPSRRSPSDSRRSGPSTTAQQAASAGRRRKPRTSAR